MYVIDIHLFIVLIDLVDGSLYDIELGEAKENSAREAVELIGNRDCTFINVRIDWSFDLARQLYPYEDGKINPIWKRVTQPALLTNTRIGRTLLNNGRNK